jgi:hypothetical protein
MKRLKISEERKRVKPTKTAKKRRLLLLLQHAFLQLFPVLPSLFELFTYFATSFFFYSF